jgi:hypothetical protein
VWFLRLRYMLQLTRRMRAIWMTAIRHVGSFWALIPRGALLELVVLVFDSGNELIIHAMAARKQYLKLPTT